MRGSYRAHCLPLMQRQVGTGVGVGISTDRRRNEITYSKQTVSFDTIRETRR
jgi:hypothetical protein